MKRTSTVQKLTLCLLNRIRNYCVEMKCGWILRYQGREIGARIHNGELRFDETIETVDYVSTLRWKASVGAANGLYVRKIDWVGILSEYACDATGWNWDRYNHLLATIDA